MLRRFSINFALFSVAIDGLAVAFSLWSAVAIRPMMNGLSWVQTIPVDANAPAALYAIFPVVWVLVYAMFSLYDGRKQFRVADEFTALVFAVIVSSISSAGILYLSFREVSRALFIAFVLFAYLLCSAWRILARIYFRTQNTVPDRDRRILIVGAGPLGLKVREQIYETGLANFNLLGFVDRAIPPRENIDLVGPPEQVSKLVETFDVSDVVIALPHSEYHQLGEIVHALEESPVQVWVALGYFDLTLYHTKIEDFAGIPMLDMRASAIDDYQRMIKRAFDLILGSIAFVLALPLLTLISAVIFLADGRPILYRQKRVGENGRLFEMLKFRTMVREAEQLQGQVMKRDADGNPIHKSKEDPRVTRVGRFLRRFSLDELPQVFNVVIGDMSLVGPRPELPQLVANYQPWQRKRFSVPPGMTGWWQVNGRSDKPMHLHTEDDLYYIQNYSIFLDVQILLKTIWVVLIGRGSY